MKDALEEAVMLSDRWVLAPSSPSARERLPHRVIQDMVGEITENISVFYKASEAVSPELNSAPLMLSSFSLDICPRSPLGFRSCVYWFVLGSQIDRC